ncbi:MAG: glutamate racemase, partial [Proteobacteria bacterium]
TVKRPYTDSLIQEFAADCKVTKVGSSRLVVIAEEKLRGIMPNRDELRSILAPFAASEPDVVALGCTHFPLLRQEISEVLPSITWIDSGDAIAKRVLHYSLTPTQSEGDGSAFFTTQDLELESLRGFGLQSLVYLPI